MDRDALLDLLHLDTGLLYDMYSYQEEEARDLQMLEARMADTGLEEFGDEDRRGRKMEGVTICARRRSVRSHEDGEDRLTRKILPARGRQQYFLAVTMNEIWRALK